MPHSIPALLKNPESELLTVCTQVLEGHWPQIWGIRNVRDCTVCAKQGDEKRTKCQLLLPAQLADMCKKQKGLCISCTEPLVLPQQEKIEEYNFVYPKIQDPGQCGTSKNASHLVCGICNNLWQATLYQSSEFNKYRKVLFSKEMKATIEGIHYNPVLIPGTKVYMSKIKKRKPFADQWNAQHGCSAVALPNQKELCIFKVPLSTSSSHLLAVKAISKDFKNPPVEGNFTLVSEIFVFLQGSYAASKFWRWAHTHVTQGVPPEGHYSIGTPPNLEATERKAVNEYGRLSKEVSEESKKLNEKKKELAQLTNQVMIQAQRLGDYEKTLAVRDHGMLIQLGRKQGGINPVTESYVLEMLPSILMQHRVISKEVGQKLSSQVWKNVVEDLYNAKWRGRKPMAHSLIVKPLVVKNNAFEC